MKLLAEKLAEPCDLSAVLKPADLLLVVPPFSHYGYASLACHLLQAHAHAAGYSASIFYANLALAKIIGLEAYKAMSHDYHQLIGERLFSRAAYGGAPFGDDRFRYNNSDGEMGRDWWGITTHQSQYDLSVEQIVELESGIDQWIGRLSDAIVEQNFKLVGCSNSFQQTTSSVALLNGIKRRQPDIVTMMGGSNCESDMARGIESLGGLIDYIFSGESDATFPWFLRQVMNNKPPKESVINGKPCHFLDALPTPTYEDYFEQLEFNLPGIIESDSIWISYETSRGCWWGEKSHCTFCGLNGGGMAFREKSADRVVDEIGEFLATSPTNNIMTTDNIMPNSYFKTLLPRLAKEQEKPNLHYEIKPNLTLERVMLLHEAGVRKIQPGIEALSSSLLKRMGKGVTAAKNIDLLRYCRMLGMDVRWNLLCHFPGDLESDWEQTLELTRVLTHLEPPQGIVPLSIDRFSPYHSDADRYGVTNIRPAAMYDGLFPDGADIDRIAYHFEGDYDAASRRRPDLVTAIARRVENWTRSWEAEHANRPKLLVQPLGSDKFLFVDTRGVTQLGQLEVIDRAHAEAALMVSRSTPEHAIDWALNRQCLIELEGKLSSLALTSTEFMIEMQQSRRTKKNGALSVDGLRPTATPDQPHGL